VVNAVVTVLVHFDHFWAKMMPTLLKTIAMIIIFGDLDHFWAEMIAIENS
jgi:hypothetical protein